MIECLFIIILVLILIDTHSKEVEKAPRCLYDFQK